MDNPPQGQPASADRRPANATTTTTAAAAAAAAAKLAARRRRVRAIRGRVAGLSVATLTATSGFVLVQLVTGNDPALAKSHSSSDVRTGATTTTQPTATTGPTASTSTPTSDTQSSHSQTTTSRPRTHTTHDRASSSSKRAASTPTTVKTSAS
jgi:hypothetical protein